MRQSSWTPGRVNLMGEWIDFNGGWVLPAALPLGVTIDVTPIAGNMDRARSAQFSGALSQLVDSNAQSVWADYVFGALQAARAKGWLDGAAEVVLDSDIPAGAGVSSSAAVTVGVLKAIAPSSADLTEIAQMARAVENNHIGVPCGIMDQMAVAHAHTGEAIALDTRSLHFNAIAIPQNWRFGVIHSGVERALADGRYKLRRDACLKAANQLDLPYLCDAELGASVEDGLAPIVRHVVTENQRTRAAMLALETGDPIKFGDLMNQTHVSLRDDFVVSTPDVDALVDSAVELGARGARITGAGFGGCIVALLDESTPSDWRESLLSRHPKARWVCDVTSRTESREP
jgi:galactokinase